MVSPKEHLRTRSSCQLNFTCPGLYSVSLQFVGLSAAKRAFQCQNAPGTDLTSTQLYLSGACGGIANSVVSGPVEHVRIRLQTQTAPAGSKAAFSGPLDVVRKLYRGNGLRGVYHAQGATLLRCAPFSLVTRR